MKLPEFKLERYFAQTEFSAPYPMCLSDCESMTIKELLSLEGADELEGFSRLWLGYTESQGGPALRRHISSLYKNINESDILVTAGAEEAIFIFMNTALSPGDHIIVQSPSYQSLHEIARSIGCEITLWEMREEDEWRPDPDVLAGYVKPNTRAIIINSPHNPTGYMIKKAEYSRVVDLARKHGLMLFSDEVYRNLEYREADRVEASCDIYENAVSLGVMSKSFGLAGLRIGWIATRNQDIYSRMASFKDYTSICNSAPSEYLASVALRCHDQIVQRNMSIIKNNLVLLDDFFIKYQDLFSWVKPEAGPIAFPCLNLDTAIDKFAADLVRIKGVLLLPGTCYGHSGNNFRIGFGRRNLPECLVKLEEYINENLRE